ncbi:hypothetical protein ACTGJ9_025820 [Bradyrhizobium sp. RDM12]
MLGNPRQSSSHFQKKKPALAHGLSSRRRRDFSAWPSAMARTKVENPKSNSAAVTEYDRQATLPCDRALKPGPPWVLDAPKRFDMPMKFRAWAGLSVLILF